MERVDFTANAKIYDQRHGALLPDQVARALTNGLTPGSRILDIGAGTGRVSVPLALLGFDVIAIEPALAMLQGLRDKAGSLSIAGFVAEGSSLPIRDQIADAIVLARLLYLVPDWRGLLDEVARVTTARGVIFHEWGNGTADEEWVQIREECRARFEEAGVKNPFHPGVRTELEVEQHLNVLGFGKMEHVDAGPGPAMSLVDFLTKVESGEVSYIWSVPRDVRETCLPRVRAWAEKRFDLTRRTPIPAERQWNVYVKDR